MHYGSKVDEETSFELMDYYYQGGRAFDTSNNYPFWRPESMGDESEITLGKWMKKRGNRKQLFIATKVGARPINKEKTEFEGLSREVIFSAVEESLKRLQTNYIDLYYMHVDWRREPLEETLKAFNDLVKSDKIKHIVCSNMDTWRLVKAKEISKKMVGLNFQLFSKDILT